MDDQTRYEDARKQVKQLKALYGHIAAFLLINIFLLAINLVTSPKQLWFVWPLLCWGFALALHAVAVFVIRGVWGPNWEERKIREIVGDLQRQP